MCGGAYFEHKGEVLRQYFPNPKAVLPVLKSDGGIILMPWGNLKSIK